MNVFCKPHRAQSMHEKHVNREHVKTYTAAPAGFLHQTSVFLFSTQCICLPLSLSVFARFPLDGDC